MQRTVSLPRELTVATPSVSITTLSSNPAIPPVRVTTSGRPEPAGVDWVTVGIDGVGVLDGLDGLDGVPPAPPSDSLPQPVRTSPTAAATAA
ncbi:hypothetical protein GCM10009743_56200 [Kribbella swartbergensis]